jgi:hypothetical protein
LLVTSQDEFMTSSLPEIFQKCRFNFGKQAGFRRHGRTLIHVHHLYGYQATNFPSNVKTTHPSFSNEFPRHQE